MGIQLWHHCNSDWLPTNLFFTMKFCLPQNKADRWSVQVSSVAQFLSTFMSPTWIHEWIHSHFCPPLLEVATLRKIESDQVAFATAGATIITLWKAGGGVVRFHLNPQSIKCIYFHSFRFKQLLPDKKKRQNCFRCPSKQLQIVFFHLKMIKFCSV